MILTVTLNPAIDKVYRTERVVTGQVNRMRSALNFPGGKGINVAKTLKLLGKEVVATGFLGGYAGKYIADAVSQLGIVGDFVIVDGETRSSINVIGDDGFVTEILEPGPAISEEKLEEFLTKYKKLVVSAEVVVLSGTAASGIPIDIYKTLTEIANSHDKKVILDASGDYLKEGIKGRPFMIKPNRLEIESLLGYRLQAVQQIQDAACRLCANGISEVVVSMGRQGIVFTNGSEIMHAVTPEVKTNNTVGSGDSVVAVYAAAYTDGLDMEETLKRATAISAAHTTTFENGNIPMDLANELIERVQIIK